MTLPKDKRKSRAVSEFLNNKLEQLDDLSQGDLASILNVSRQLINGVMNERNEVTTEFLVRLSAVFTDFDPEDYLELELEDTKDQIDDYSDIQEAAKDQGIR